MGRELQKKKRRAGKQPVRRKPKSKKQVLQNELIAENWYAVLAQQSQRKTNYHRDPRKTLSQNYRNIGLVSKLGHRAGGVEKKVDGDGVTSARNEPLAILPGTTHTQKPVAEVQLEVDPETGNPVLSKNAGSQPHAWGGGALNEPDDSDDDEPNWTSLGRLPTQRGGTSVTAALETLAAGGIRHGPRKQSQREQAWVERLVEKHGENYSAMFRDAVLNPMQQSEGDIRRRVLLWRRNKFPETS
jgi:nucleolar protein 16